MRGKRNVIIIISPSNFPGTTGDTINYTELVKAFNRKGLRVVLICPWANQGKQFDREMKEIGVKVTRVPFYSPRVAELSENRVGLTTILRLFAYYILELFVVVYAVIRNRARIAMVRHSIQLIPVALLLKLLRVRSVADGEILASSRECPVFFSPLVQKILGILENVRLYNFFKVTGESQPRALVQIGFPESRIIFTKIGVDLASIPVFKLDQIPPATYGYFGYLVEWQGVDFLIRSFAKAAQRNKSIKLYIIGDGPSRNELIALSKELELGDKIYFSGAVPREVLWHDYFRKFRVTVIPLPPLKGVVHRPIKLAESLAAGKPVISTSMRALEGMEGKGVLLVQPGDEEDMVQALLRLAEDTRLLNHLSQQALKAAQEFDVNVQITRILHKLVRANDN